MLVYAIKAGELFFSERTMFQGNSEQIIRKTVEFLARRLHSYLKSLEQQALAPYVKSDQRRY